MRRAIQMLRKAHPQTLFFIFTIALYMVAIAWTTVQSYARLTYSRSDVAAQKVIYIPTQKTK